MYSGRAHDRQKSGVFLYITSEQSERKQLKKNSIYISTPTNEIPAKIVLKTAAARDERRPEEMERQASGTGRFSAVERPVVLLKVGCAESIQFLSKCFPLRVLIAHP